MLRRMRRAVLPRRFVRGHASIGFREDRRTMRRVRRAVRRDVSLDLLSRSARQRVRGDDVSERRERRRRLYDDVVASVVLLRVRDVRGVSRRDESSVEESIVIIVIIVIIKDESALRRLRPSSR